MLFFKRFLVHCFGGHRWIMSRKIWAVMGWSLHTCINFFIRLSPKQRSGSEVPLELGHQYSSVFMFAIIFLLVHQKHVSKLPKYVQVGKIWFFFSKQDLLGPFGFDFAGNLIVLVRCIHQFPSTVFPWHVYPAQCYSGALMIFPLKHSANWVSLDFCGTIWKWLMSIINQHLHDSRYLLSGIVYYQQLWSLPEYAFDLVEELLNSSSFWKSYVFAHEVRFCSCDMWRGPYVGNIYWSVAMYQHVEPNFWNDF